MLASRWLVRAIGIVALVCAATGVDAEDESPKVEAESKIESTAAPPESGKEVPVAESPAGHAAEGGKHDDQGHAEAGHGHDSHDLTHANMTSEAYSPAQFQLQLATGTAVVFALLLLLLGKFAWGPIAKGLDAREASIANMIAEAKRNQEETAAQLKLYEGKLSRAADEAREVVNQARREAEGVASKIVGDAQAQATVEKERAVAEIRAAKNAALSEIAQRSVNTAVSLAGNLIRREVRPEDHEAMIQESLNQFRQN